jgi:predicted transcriptional regulator
MSKIENPPFALEALFGSRVRIKILKFLFRNYPNNLETKDLADKLQESPDAIRREIKLLETIGLIIKK